MTDVLCRCAASAIHAFARAPGKVALFCRLAWLEGVRRRRLFETTPLARVWVLSRRPQMRRGREPGPGERGRMIAFVWDRDHQGRPDLGWLP